MNNGYWQVIAYTKDGEYDHDVGVPYYSQQQAEDACKTYQSVCCKTGMVYKVEYFND